MKLIERKCVVCTGKETPLTPEQAEIFLQETEGWQMLEDATLIIRELEFDDFITPFELVKKIAALAEEQGHHPDIAFGWGYCSIALHTDAIEALHENDFIMAAKINQLIAQ